MGSSSREEIVEVFDSLGADLDRLGELSFDVFTTPKLLRALERLERVARRPAHPPIQTLVDISHVRWATGNAITAIDLCAATVGRLFCGITAPPELILRDFNRKSNRRKRDRARCRTLSGLVKWVRRQRAITPSRNVKTRRALLPSPFEDWVKDTSTIRTEIQTLTLLTDHGASPNPRWGGRSHPLPACPVVACVSRAGWAG